MSDEMNEKLEQLQRRILELETREAERHVVRRNARGVIDALRHKRKAFLIGAAAALAFGAATYLYAAGATITAAPNRFTAGDAISASQMNQNFDALDANDTALNAQLAGLDSSHWTYSPGSPTRIGYTGGFVGIGTAAPVCGLDIKLNRPGEYAANLRNDGATGHGMAFNTPASALAIGFFSTDSGSTMTGYISSINGTATLYGASDRRLKNGIVDTRVSLADLMAVRVRDFSFKSDPEARLLTGFIAQELYDIYPDAVAKPAKEDDIWCVDYGKLTPLLVKAVQDQQRIIDALEAKNAALEARVDAIAKKLGS